MVRATPTGVSAVIDAYGRSPPGDRMAPGEEGVMDRRLPAALAPTLYADFGEAPFWGMLALCFACAVPLHRRR